MSQSRCPNMNHGRAVVTIKYCPNCGEVVNRAINQRCDPTEHQKQRKQGGKFCMHCGQAL